MNPRLNDSFKAHRDFEDVTSYENAESESAINKFIGGYKEQSHGQVMLPLLLANKDVKGKTLFFDEPEAGLSIRSQYKVMEHFRKLSKNNQLVIATHSPIFMEEVGEVYSLEHRKIISATDFINWQKGLLEI